MTASLSGSSVVYSAANYDPLGRPMAATSPSYSSAPTAYSSGDDGPNWVVIGSIGGVALVLLIVVGIIAATSLSGGGGVPIAANNAPPAGVSPTIDPAVSPAGAPSTAGPAASPGDAASIPPFAPMPAQAETTPALAPMATPSPAAAPIAASPMGPPASLGGPGAIASGAPVGSGTRGPMVGPADPFSPASRPPGSSATGSSAPSSTANATSAGNNTRMVKITSGKNRQHFVETPESVPAKPHGFATALPVWHGDARAKLAGVFRVGNDSRTTMQGHYSWMHNVLPFLGHQDIYDKFDLTKPLHDDRNMTMGCILVPEYLVPGNPKQRWDGYPFDHLALTHFVGMSGVEDARNVVAGKLDRSDPRAGMFGYDRIAAASEITDGASQTIAVIGVGDLANPWVMGGGSTIRGARQPYFDKLTGFGTHGQKGAMTMMADGSVRLISENIDPAVFRAMCTIHGTETVELPVAAPPFQLD